VFLVHKEVICAKSKFFAAGCSERWAEGKEKQVALPDVEASIFQSYLTWVYCGQLNITCFSNEDINKLSCQSSRAVAKYLELYFLGDVLDDVRLRNKVLQTLVLGADNMLHVQTVQRVWEKTPNNSPVRRMMVDRATLRGQRTHLLENLTKFPEDFVQQVAAALLREVPTKDQEVFKEKLPSYLEPVKEAY
jgi:hypothetical protein